MARDGATPLSMLDAHPSSFVRYRRHIEGALQATQGYVFSDNIQTAVLWGDSRSGKSHWAFTPMRGARTAYVKDNTIWWNNYQREKVVIIDEFRWSKVDVDLFLKWTDKWPKQEQVKGDYTRPAYDLVIITTNEDPASWYYGTPQYDAVQERLVHVSHFTGKFRDGTQVITKTKGDHDLLNWA